jgi:hypothetical protein
MPSTACDKMGFYCAQGLRLQSIVFIHKMNQSGKIFSSVVNLLRFTLKFISTANSQTDVILLTESSKLDEDSDLQHNQYNRTNKMHYLLSEYYYYSLYMFQALIRSSSGGTVYTAIGIFCVYYVGWLLAGLEWNFLVLLY